MSLESGRRLGLTASIIYVIVPVVAVALYGVLFISLITSITSAVNGNSSAIGSSFLGAGLIIFAIIGLAVLAIIGLILLLIGMHHLSQYYNERGIFSNLLYGVIIQIVGVAVLIGIVIALVVSASHFLLRQALQILHSFLRSSLY